VRRCLDVPIPGGGLCAVIWFERCSAGGTVRVIVTGTRTKDCGVAVVFRVWVSAVSE
jgi:hypothetical protein